MVGAVRTLKEIDDEYTKLIKDLKKYQANVFTRLVELQDERKECVMAETEKKPKIEIGMVHEK